MDPFAFLNIFTSLALLRFLDVSNCLFVVQAGDAGNPSIYSIEGMRGQEYSVGIFIFMLTGVLVFASIILRFIWMARKESRLKTGEKVMFVWIILGTFVAVVFGGLQLLQGRLF
jgi:hypothetical protein